VSATERLVVSPGQVENGILHMPGGQSGHPLSPHYRDQQQAWSEGTALPFIGLPPQHMLTLVPFSSLS
jgi:penicillin amidase